MKPLTVEFLVLVYVALMVTVSIMPEKAPETNCRSIGMKRQSIIVDIKRKQIIKQCEVR